MPTYERADLTALTESRPRTAKIDTLQYHHGTVLSTAALRSLMNPGGRTVSSNLIATTDGELILVVPFERRALTSASEFDNRCITVETVNTTLGPDWGISDESHRRLGRLAAEMLQEGLLGGLHYGPGGIIGHRDVPGTYATACPGPSFDADLILKYARESLAPAAPQRRRHGMTTMFVKKSTMGSNPNAGLGSLWAMAGDVGAPCSGNWIEFTRDPADGSVNDRGRRLADVHGNAVILEDAEWDVYRKSYTEGGGVQGGGVTVGSLKLDPATIAALAKANAEAFFIEQKKAGN